MKKIFEAQGKYCRTILVEKDNLQCFECTEEKECLSFDSSDKEYSTMIFCRECLNSFFEAHISASNYENDLSGQE